MSEKNMSEILYGPKEPVEFHFSPGKLYIRVHGNKKALHFEIPGEQWHMGNLAEMAGGVTTPQWGSSRETQKELVSVAGDSMSEIGHYLATDDDLREMIKTFHDDSPYGGLDAWLKYVEKSDGLDTFEKDRIKRISTEAQIEINKK